VNEAKAAAESTLSSVARLGQACSVALLAALVTAVPTALRASGAGASLLDGWLVGAAVWVGLLLPVALLRHRAARGFRGVMGADPPVHLGLTLALWAGLAVLLLTLLGGVLKATTHHRGLGGATFGVVGVGLVLAALVLAVRLRALGRRLHERGLPSAAIVVGVLLVALGPPLYLAGTGLLAPAETSPHGAAVRAALLDLLLGVAVLSLLTYRDLAARLRRLAHVGAVVVTLAVVAAGFARVELADGVGRAVRSSGGVVAAVVGWLESWSDRDGDGAGAHFGGGDCDEGDPARRPGADDVPGDGVDRDCDGTDGPRPTPPADQAVAAPAAPADAPATERSSDGAAATRLAADRRPRPEAAAASSADGRTQPAGSAAVAVSAAPAQPDIVLVTLDAVGAKHSSTYGYAKKTTPALSELADGGVLFTAAFAIGSTTQRALTPVVTGRPISASRRSADEWPTLLDDNDTLAERLAAAGYATGAVTSFTWLRQDRGFHQGFDLFDESPFREEHPERGVTGTLAVAAARKTYAKLSEGSKPLFLWVHLFDAHAKHVEHPGHDFGGGDYGLYDGEVAFVDARLGEIAQLVAASPRAARTALLVHGTHGIAFGEHGRRGHGREVYDEMIRVPLLIAAPWAKRQRYDARAVSTLDLAPTVLDLAGASQSGIDGVSLRPVVEGRELDRGPVFAYAWQRRCVVDWPFKLLARSREDRPDRLLLFDLAADPTEQHDVSADQPEALRRLDALLRQAEES
jgi:arylsulfatase A-like enzyme